MTVIDFDKLDETERAVVEWQYRLCGGFKSALWDAIARADEGNLARLRLGFPHEVDGFLKFSRLPGWWPEVQERARTGP
jgi:hypothetical protein